METQLLLSSQLAIGEFLARWSRREPSREAVIYLEKRFTYRELNERVNRLANGLQSLVGVGRSDKVALLLKNCNQIVESFCATCKLGAVAVPLNFRLAGPEVAYQVNDSDSSILIYGREFHDLVNSIRGQILHVESYICIDDTGDENTIAYEKLLDASGSDERMLPVNDDDPAFVMYTSGTTERPKGAMMTHKSMLLNALFSTLEVPGLPNERCLCTVPRFRAAALASYLKMLLIGGAIIIRNQFDPEDTLK